MNWGTHLDEALVKPVDTLQSLRVGEGQGVRTKPHDVSVLLVQLDVRHLGPLPIDVPEAPPVRQGGEEGARVAVEAIVEAVLEEPGRGGDGGYGEPVLAEEREGALDECHSAGGESWLGLALLRGCFVEVYLHQRCKGVDSRRKGCRRAPLVASSTEVSPICSDTPV